MSFFEREATRSLADQSESDLLLACPNDLS